MSNAFDKDGKYYAELTVDGKLKVWETGTNTLKQELTLNLHLTSPSTCLHWVHVKALKPWKKRKRRQSNNNNIASEDLLPFIALGTKSGVLLFYSFASAQIETTVNSETNDSISCLTWNEQQQNGIVYGATDRHILGFDLKDKSVTSKWSTGKDRVKSILVLSHKPRLLTASRAIKLWNLATGTVIKTFVGHTSAITLLSFIPSRNGDPYFVSASQADRLLSCWSLNENVEDKNAVASLLMEDVAVTLSVMETSECIHLAVVTRSGVLHMYQYALNGKCGKPIKPKTTIQIVSEGSKSKELVTPIPILAVHYQPDKSILIGYGNNLIHIFELVTPTNEKVQCLMRQDPTVLKQQQTSLNKDESITKTKQPKIDNKTVDYLTPYVSNNYKLKRKIGGQDGGTTDFHTEVPMEQRLENLTLNKLDSIPKQDNVAQLLVQGLRSKDKTILQNVLSKRNETVIKNTVRRLPMPVIIPLLTELTTLVQGKTLASQTGVLWLRYVIQLHTGQLLSNPKLIDMISPLLGTIENRLTLLTPLSRLRGRLDLLLAQISDTNTTDNKETEVEDPLLLYKDQGSSDSENSDNIELALHSDSENEWIEEENSGLDSNVDDDDELKLDENNVSGSEMSL